MKPWEMNWETPPEEEKKPWEMEWEVEPPATASQADRRRAKAAAKSATEEAAPATSQAEKRRKKKTTTNDPSKLVDLGALGRGAVEGATLNYAGELSSAVRAPFTGKTYEEELADYNKTSKEVEKRAPTSYGIGEVAGSLAPGAGVGGAALRILRSGAGPVAKTLGIGGMSYGAGTAAEYGHQEKKDLGAAATSVPAIVEGTLGAAVPGGIAIGNAVAPTLKRFASRIPGVRQIAGEQVGRNVAARELESELAQAGIRTNAALGAEAARKRVSGTGAPQFLSVAPRRTTQARYLRNLEAMDDLPVSGGEHSRLIRELRNPQGSTYGDRVSRQFRREAGVRGRSDTRGITDDAEVRRLYDEIEALRGRLRGRGGTTVPGLGQAFLDSSDASDVLENIYNRAAQNMGTPGPGQVRFKDPKFPTFGREYERRLKKWERAKNAAKAAAKDGRGTYSAAQWQKSRPVELADDNLPTSVIMEIYNDATAESVKGDVVAKRVLATLQENLANAADNSRAGEFRDLIAQLRGIKGSGYKEGIKSASRTGPMAEVKKQQDWAKLPDEKRPGFREGTVHKQEYQLRNKLDSTNPEKALEGIVDTPSARDTYAAVVRPPGGRGMTPGQLQRDVKNIKERQELAKDIEGIAGSASDGKESMGGVALETARRGLYSKWYAAQGVIERINNFKPQIARQVENDLMTRPIGEIAGEMNRIRQLDMDNRQAREYYTVVRRALANALTRTYGGGYSEPEE